MSIVPIASVAAVCGGGKLASCDWIEVKTAVKGLAGTAGWDDAQLGIKIEPTM